MKQLAGWDSATGPSWFVEFEGIDEQLRFLRKMVSKYRMQANIRDLAMKIIRDAGVTERDKKEQAVHIAHWVQSNVYYVHELPERFATPDETLRTKAGDCDDQTVLTASLLESVGIPTKLVCMSINGKWAHIYPAAIMQSRGTLLPLDTTMKTSVYDVQNPIEVAQSRGKKVTIKLA